MTEETQQNTTPEKRPPRWAKPFLAALRETGNVRAACDAVGIERSTAYDRKNSNPDFEKAWGKALDDAADLLEQEARRRAHEGVRRLKFDRGRLITIPLEDAEGKPVLDKENNPVMVPYVEHEYSDTLLIFLLKGAKPEKYRDRHEVDHKGKVEVEYVNDWRAPD